MNVNATLDRGIWRLRWTIDGKRYSLSTGIKNNQQDKRLNELIRLIERDIKLGMLRDKSYYKAIINPKKTQITLAEVFEQFTNSRKDLQFSTRKVIYGTVLSILKRCPLTLENADELPNWLVNCGYSQHTIRRTLNRCSACLEWAIENRLTFSNPLADVKLPKAKKGKAIDPFSLEECSLILQSALQKNQLYYYLIKFLLLSGCRPSEALGLVWGDIQQDYICFNKAIVLGNLKNKLKTQDSRLFPINSQLRDLLASLPKTGDRLFPVDWNRFRNFWKSLLQQNSIKYRPPYNLRHTFISCSIDKGLSPAAVAKLAGNSCKTIFAHYLGLGDCPQIPKFEFESDPID